MLCLHHRRYPPQRRVMARHAILLVLLTAVRTAAVAGQPTLGPFLICFAPTELAMHVNMASCVGYALLLVLTSRSERWGGACVRPQCRVWLAFVAVTYFGSSMGYFMFASTDISVTAALWIGQVAHLVYAIGFGPALYATFARERAYWLDHPWLGAALPVNTHTSHAERLLDGVIAGTTSEQCAATSSTNATRTSKADTRERGPSCTGPTVRGSREPTGNASAAAAPRASPEGFYPWGTDGQSAEMLRVALGGVRLIRYAELEIHELIGSGGFSEVFRARWVRETSTDSAPIHRSCESSLSADPPRSAAAQMPALATAHQVAVKQLRMVSSDPSALASFCTEIRLMQQLSHPNVLGLLGVSTSPSGSLAMVTPFMSRGSVFQMLHPPPPAPPQAAPPPRILAIRMLADCAQGVAYLHACTPPIIHRDLKSPNLLVAPDYSVKVADFGLARLQPGTTSRIGSVQWAAPEILLGKTYSHKCDAWSFGVVCWEMVTAQVPFEGISAQQVAAQVAMDGMRLPVPHGAPNRLLRLIARCWSESPELRPEFDHVLVELQGIEHELLARADAAVGVCVPRVVRAQ